MRTYLRLATLVTLGACTNEIDASPRGIGTVPDCGDQVNEPDAALPDAALPDAALPDATLDAATCGFEHAPPCGSACENGLFSIHVNFGAPQTCERLPRNPFQCGGLYEQCCVTDSCNNEVLGCDLSHGMMLCVD